MVGLLDGWAGWLVGLLAGWLVEWLAGFFFFGKKFLGKKSLDGWRIAWGCLGAALVGWLVRVGWPAGWLGGWLAGWLDAWLGCWMGEPAG